MTWIGPDWFLALVAITLCVMLALSLLPSKPHPHPHSQGTTGVGKCGGGAGWQLVRQATKSSHPRLWGEWDCAFYGSGTTIVTLKEHQHRPWLYVYADAAISESRYMADRFAMCYALRDFMNGGSRPPWLDDLERRSETTADSPMGASISATGPLVDRNPPACDWWTDDSDDAANDRARLMDALFLKGDA